ncbi:hypothetical protein FS837_011667 [Tulasnella sp. UAMH 9824]|nr:hypothetical protein FS837_011667 [Tulasnella sp. UAMH 9824]
MVVSFGISKKALIDDFKQWPELASELEQLSFKRYLGMVACSSVFDPKDRWLSPQPPPEAPPESTQLYLIGSQPPSIDYFPNFLKEMYPSEAAGLCRAISTAPRAEPTADEARQPYQLTGPPLICRKLETGYLYTTTTVNVRAKSVTPYKSADGTTKGWRIVHNGISSICDDRFKDVEDKLWQLWAEYKRQHNSKEPMPGYELEGGKFFLNGIEHQLRLAEYDVPVEVSLDIDVDEELEDPCDFKKEVTAVRRTLYKYRENLKDFDPRADKEAEMSDCASDARKLDLCSWPQFDSEEVSPLSERCHVMKSLMQDIAGIPKRLVRRQPESFLAGVITGLIVGLGAASLASAYTFRRVPLR